MIRFVEDTGLTDDQVVCGDAISLSFRGNPNLKGSDACSLGARVLSSDLITVRKHPLYPYRKHRFFRFGIVFHLSKLAFRSGLASSA
jgi:hypothetical protein